MNLHSLQLRSVRRIQELKHKETHLVINLCRATGLALFVWLAAPAAAQAPPIRVTLLGTGCPPAVMNRFGTSTLVEAGEQKFLFDAGRGATQRLLELGVPWRKVQGVFLTHLHSDHVVGFPDLWLTGWLIAPGQPSRSRYGVRPAPPR